MTANFYLSHHSAIANILLIQLAKLLLPVYIRLIIINILLISIVNYILLSDIYLYMLSNKRQDLFTAPPGTSTLLTGK